MIKNIQKSLKSLIPFTSWILSISVRTITILVSSILLASTAFIVFVTGIIVTESPDPLRYFLSDEGLEWAVIIGTAFIVLFLISFLISAIWKFSIKRFWKDTSYQRVREWITA